MKAKIALLFLLLTGLIRAQSQFIIGADWLNSNTNSGIMSDSCWHLIHSFNLNFGSLNIGHSEAETDLDNAYLNGIKMELKWN